MHANELKKFQGENGIRKAVIRRKKKQAFCGFNSESESVESLDIESHLFNQEEHKQMSEPSSCENQGA